MKNKNQILIDDANMVISKVDLSGINGCKILVAGASGLIGTHIVYSIKQYVETTGADVELYIITRGELPAQMDFANECGWIKVFKGEMTDSSFLRALPAVDIIIDAAGYGQPLRFMNEAANTLKINTYTIFELMEKLKRPGKFLFMSSSAVYTGLSETPFREEEVGNSNTNHPRACYIEGKKCGEAICNAYRMEGVDAKSVRLSITYGPGTKKDDVRVMNTFIRSALIEKQIKLLDDGKAQKAFMYVSDAVELIWKMLLFGKESIYNIGGSEQISIAQLAHIIGDYCNAPVILNEGNRDAVKGAIAAELLSMERVAKEFGKNDYIGIEQGTRRTINWARLNLYDQT
ncbi:MAG: NAD-dependent epimerase/dehydratase family protein [Clostridiales bacterium]|nr:NAD-dependent epimerase/dehydratase family protein [Clostridiales bacterium]